MSASQNRRLAHQVNVGLTTSEALAIDRAARALRVSRAGFVRGHVLALVEMPETTRPRRYAAMTTADLEAVAELIASLGRVTGATVLLARELRQAGHADRYRAERVLAELREQSDSAAMLIGRLSDQR